MRILYIFFYQSHRKISFWIY